MKAALNNYRQSPRKVRVVADLMRGKTVAEALKAMQFTTKRATGPLKKLIESAYANAINGGVESPETLVVKEIQVNNGVTLKRIMPRAMGSASRINKRSCHITIVLGNVPPKRLAAQAAKAARKAGTAVAKDVKPASKKAKKTTK